MLLKYTDVTSSAPPLGISEALSISGSFSGLHVQVVETVVQCETEERCCIAGLFIAPVTLMR